MAVPTDRRNWLEEPAPGDPIKASQIALGQEVGGAKEFMGPHAVAHETGFYQDDIFPAWCYGRLDEDMYSVDNPNTPVRFQVYQQSKSDGSWSTSNQVRHVYPGFNSATLLEQYGRGHTGRAIQHPNGRWYFIPDNWNVRIELQEDYTQWSDTPVQACVKKWDPTANSNEGGYVITDERIRVCDWRKVGYHGDAGAEGAAKVKWSHSEAGEEYVTSYEFKDLECPPECVCGVVDPDADVGCDGSGLGDGSGDGS